MMKKLLFVVAFMAFAVGINEASAQAGRVVRPWEIEFGGGITSPTEKLHFDKTKPGWTALAEVRYNFRRRSIDLGLHVDGAVLNRQSQPIEGLKELKEAKFASLTGLIVGDVNFFRSKGLSFFAGVGVGYGMLISDFQKVSQIKDIDKVGCFCVMPRVGFEIAHHVRATLYYKQLKKGQNHYGANIGIVLGGGKKGLAGGVNSRAKANGNPDGE